MNGSGNPLQTEAMDFSIEDMSNARERIKLAEDRLASMRQCLVAFSESEAKYTLLKLEYESIVHSRAWRLMLGVRILRHYFMPRGTFRERLMLGTYSRLKRLIRGGTRGKIAGRPDESDYKLWIAEREEPALARYPLICESPNAPRLRFFLTEAGDGKVFEKTVDSLLRQSDPAWELRIASPTATESVRDDRIHCEVASSSESGVEWIRKHLEELESGYAAELVAGDRLHPRAVSIFRDFAARHAEAALISCDEDRFDHRGCRTEPIFKPQWSEETLRSHDYLGALKLVSIEAAKRSGGLNSLLGPIAGYDLALRLAESREPFLHIPHVLIHAAPRADSKERVEQAILAVQHHLDRQSIRADVARGLLSGTQQIRYETIRPLLSIIIPSKDQPKLLERCVESIDKSRYANREILIIDNQSVQEATHASNAKLSARKGVRLIDYPHPFNFAAMNNFAARRASGELFLFLNNDTEAIDGEWLDRMIEHAMRPQVGAVGAKLLYPNGAIQHAGIILAMNDGTCGHYQRFFAGDSTGYANRLMVVQNLAAVTGACLMIRRSVFEAVAGFDEMFAQDFNDVDLCLRIREKGYQIIWTPYSKLYHHEGLTRGKSISIARMGAYKVEQNLFLQRWNRIVAAGDPFYNPNLTLRDEACGLRW